MTGKKIYKLTVIGVSHVGRNGTVYWKCKCSCGNPILKIYTESVLQRVKSCGCWNRTRHELLFKDLINNSFGRWIVLSFYGKNYLSSLNNSKPLWICQCSCENRTLKLVDTYALLDGGSLSCGCLQIEKAKLNCGDKHYNWKHDKAQEERVLQRKTLEDSRWSESVKKRDNWTCQITNITGGKLCSHHLEGWAWCKEKRYDLNNGITLSKPIHDFFHKLYGKGKNTKEQFLEFKNRYDSGEWLDYQI